MINMAAKLSKTTMRISLKPLLCLLQPPSVLSTSTRFLASSKDNYSHKANPVALQMINYALSSARGQKSDESYAQGLLVLEQCYSTQLDENSKGMVLLAMSTLLSERGNFEEAIEKLHRIQDLNLTALVVRVAASEALVGLHLEMGQDDTSSVLADVCLQLLEPFRLDIAGCVSETLEARAKALKGLVELVRGNLESAESYFQEKQDEKKCSGNVALSYGEFLHAKRNFPVAKQLYQKVIQDALENRDLTDPYNLAACNMTAEEDLLAATCALGQLEGHVGNFGDSEELLTTALKKAEEHFGSHHPKIGIILTCIALMYRHKATVEKSSSLLIQEGLYRKAIELLKAPPLETDADRKIYRADVIALARGGYAETLCIQQNRKEEGEKMKHWAENAWKNQRLSLAKAIELSESSSEVAVVDTRICRAL